MDQIEIVMDLLILTCCIACSYIEHDATQSNSNKETYGISNRFVREDRIVEYGSMLAKSIMKQIHRGKIMKFYSVHSPYRGRDKDTCKYLWISDVYPRINRDMDTM